MKKLILLFVFILLLNITPAAPPAGSNWQLIWSDEFDSGSTPVKPNANYWGYESGYVRNREWQYYTNKIENAYCQNGYLNIVALKHPAGTYPVGSETGQDGSISSASIRSMGKVAHKYGYLEMRANVETQWGTWGAWWTLGASGQWPDCGECDIFEFYQNKLHFNVAWWKTGDPTWTARWDGVTKNINDFGSGWSNNFHVWGMEWNPDKVKLYLDGVLYNSWNTSQDTGDSSIEGFQQKHYMLINQAIGGNAGGNASGVNYPTSYVVDYVRWYQDPTTYVNDDDGAVTYSGTWGTWTGNPGYMNDCHFSETSGSESTFTFTGTKAYYYGYQRADLGYADILLDGKLVDTVDCYSSTNKYFALLYESSDLPYGPHTLTVRVAGTKNPASSGTEIIVDAFGYLNAPKQLYDRKDFTVNTVRGTASTETGNKFITGTNPPTITGLGIIDLDDSNPGVDPDGDGLLQSHRVTLWHDSNGAKIAEVIVPAGTAGMLIDSFRYAALPQGPVTLAPNTAYVVSADSTGTLDYWLEEERLTPNAEFVGDNMYTGTTWQPRWGTPGTKPASSWHTGFFYGFANVTAETLFRADFDNNARVDEQDLVILAQHWLQSTPAYDIAPNPKDGIINLLEFQVLAEEWLP